MVNSSLGGKYDYKILSGNSTIADLSCFLQKICDADFALGIIFENKCFICL